MAANGWWGQGRERTRGGVVTTDRVADEVLALS